MKKTIFLVLLGMFLSGCVELLASGVEIQSQDSAIAASMKNATQLLEFQDLGQLASFKPGYANQSQRIEAACTKIEKLDWSHQASTESRNVCGIRKSLDDCFFYLEKTKMRLKNDSNVAINLDSVDVLCRDLRSVGLDTQVEEFKSRYTGYMAWLQAENDIRREWQNTRWQIQNYTYEGIGASASEYYQAFKGSIDKVKVSLQAIRESCKLQGGFEATDATVGNVCRNIETYSNDAAASDQATTDLYRFANKFYVGTVSVDADMVQECREAGQQIDGLYDLQLFRDIGGVNRSNFTSSCDSLEEAIALYDALGIPLVFDNGELSSNTKIAVLKTKTVYIQTEYGLGSGVLLLLDPSLQGYYVLTNAHVVLETDSQTGQQYSPASVRVKFYDGHLAYATKLYVNKEQYDLAILYVPISSAKYPTATYTPGAYPPVGTDVIAIGNPYGLEFSVTRGTVSGIRDAGCFNFYCYGAVIQTDAAINPGNSGGGLWDFKTLELLGINSLALTEAQGINFAISMDQYEQIKDIFEYYVLR